MTSPVTRPAYEDLIIVEENDFDIPDDDIMGEDLSDEAPSDECLERDDPSDDDSPDDSSLDEDGKAALAYELSQLSGIIGPPQNGHDYLRYVERERAQYPDIFSAQEQLSSLNSSRSIQHKNTNRDYPLGRQDDDLILRDEIIGNFKRLREKMDAIRGTKTVQSLQEQEKISEKQMKKTMDYSVRQANSLIKLMELGHPPQVSTLITKSQLELHLTLERLADQCDIDPSSSKTIHTDWIYSLIAALREPIEPDIYSTLRRLARICIERRRIYEDKAAEKARTSSTALAGSSSVISSNNSCNNNESIKPTSSGQCEAVAPAQSSGQSSKGSRMRQTGKASGNNEELVKELEEEEYTSSLLIICIVRYYFGQRDLK